LFQVGQRLTLSYIDERSIDCTIVEIRGSFVRCDQPKPDTFSRVPPYVTWYHLATTRSVSIRAAQP
jgi:hypothetical protein